MYGNETPEHRQLRLSLERELGCGIDSSKCGQMTETEMREWAVAYQAKRRKTAGLRALKAKIGYEKADQYIFNKSGRHIHR